MADKFDIFQERVRRDKQGSGELARKLYSSEPPGRPAQEVIEEAAKAAPAGARAGNNANGAGEQTVQTPAAVPEEEINTAAYGFVRGIAASASDIVFEKRDGSSPSLGYGWLFYKNHLRKGDGKRPGALIELEFTTGERVEIPGRNLQPLFDSLHRRRVFRISEMSEEQISFAGKDATVVYEIRVIRPQKEKGKKP